MFSIHLTTTSPCSIQLNRIALHPYCGMDESSIEGGGRHITMLGVDINLGAASSSGVFCLVKAPHYVWQIRLGLH